MPVTVTSKSTRGATRSQSDDEAIILQSLKRWKISEEAESGQREKALEDLKFSIGTGQWDEAVKSSRELEGKPCLVVNRANTFLRQYTGEERQRRPAMIVSPVGENSDEDVADIFQGMLRHTEVISDADYVYDVSYDMMLRIGFAYWRCNPEYIHEKSFKQEPRIQAIDNPFSVLLSPIRNANYCDPLWAHVVQDLGKDEYEEKYPKSKLIKNGWTTKVGNGMPSWLVKDGGARIGEYWWLELDSRNLVLLDDGTTRFRDELPRRFDKGKIVGDRDTVTRKVRWIKHNQIEILERRDYPGRYIPLIEINGLRLHVENTIFKSGLIRDYRDAQRIYDFMVTRAVEQVDLTGKDPLYVAEGSIDGREDEYRQMNRKNNPYMLYKAFNGDGQALPPPTRANREPPIQAMVGLIHQADYDMKAVTGIYGNGPGEQSNANESAFAVMTRETQEGTDAINWADNLNRGIRYQGQILVDLWPKLVDGARIQRIISPDDQVKHQVIYNSLIGDTADQQDEATRLMTTRDMFRKIFDVGTEAGEYDVVISTGPMFRTARKEAFKAIGSLIEADPQIFPILGDIWMKYGDFAGSHVLAERLRKLVPPNLLDDDGTDPDQKIAALQSTLTQMGQQHQQLTMELQRAVDTIRTQRIQVESKERIALFSAQAGMIEALIKASSAAGLEAMKAELSTIQNRMEALHANMSIEQDAGVPGETPELPGKVEPKTLPMTPAAPTAPIPGTTGVPQQ